MGSGGVWPIAGDSPTAILRRVAGAYRARLYEVDPKGCAAIDDSMIGWGQGWVVVRDLPFDMDDWLTARQAADLACVEVRRIGYMRRLGLLEGRAVGHRWQYLARDVIAAFARPRTQLTMHGRGLSATERPGR